MLFEKESCDFIVSMGGGSAIDTAKGIKEKMPEIRHLTIPATAGTGSESTRFAVLYRDGEKFSLESDSLLPEYVILDPGYLATLPIYHKKSAALDALCQAIESLWAKAQSPESRAYALGATQILWEDIDAYIAGDQPAALRILQASNLSGKAINISKTTAAHAMSYKLSTLFGIAHGHAVALCLPLVWKHMIAADAVPDVLTQGDYDNFVTLCTQLNLSFEQAGEVASMAEELAASVNTQRLGNHPVELSHTMLADMYCAM